MALAELAQAGAGLALLPPWLGERDGSGPRLRRVLPEWETPPVATWAVHRVELRSSARLRAFLTAVRDAQRLPS